MKFCTLLIVERIWATWYFSFGFVETLLRCEVGSGSKSGSSEEMLMEEAIVVGVVGVVEFQFGPCIFWNYTNGPNQVAADPYLQKWEYQKQHRGEAEEHLAGGRRTTRIYICVCENQFPKRCVSILLHGRGWMIFLYRDGVELRRKDIWKRNLSCLFLSVLGIVMLM